jgi:hypothetical protein
LEAAMDCKRSWGCGTHWNPSETNTATSVTYIPMQPIPTSITDVAGVSFPELTWKLRRMDEVVGMWEAVGLFWNCLSAGEQSRPIPYSIANFLTFMRCAFSYPPSAAPHRSSFLLRFDFPDLRC